MPTAKIHAMDAGNMSRTACGKSLRMETQITFVKAEVTCTKCNGSSDQRDPRAGITVGSRFDIR